MDERSNYTIYFALTGNDSEYNLYDSEYDLYTGSFIVSVPDSIELSNPINKMDITAFILWIGYKFPSEYKPGVADIPWAILKDVKDVDIIEVTGAAKNPIGCKVYRIEDLFQAMEDAKLTSMEEIASGSDPNVY